MQGESVMQAVTAADEVVLRLTLKRTTTSSHKQNLSELYKNYAIFSSQTSKNNLSVGADDAEGE